MGFRSLQRSKVRKSTCRGRCQRPLRSAYRVWLPSWRFTPSEPVPVLFRTGGALGIRPSELSPLGRYPPRFRAEEPTYRFTRRLSRRQRRWAGPTGRGFWALTLPGVPRGQRGFNALTAGCSLGLHPSRVCRQRPCPGFSLGSSHTLRRRPPLGERRPASRSLFRSPLGSIRCIRQAGHPAQSNPFRVLAPARSRAFEPAAALAIGLPCAPPCITADRRALFGRSYLLDRSCSGRA